MIIGSDFVWLHFPKCAGSAVEDALRAILKPRRDVRLDPIDHRNVIWHQTVRERERYDPQFRLGDRKVICGIRRLPHWVLSRVHFEAQRRPAFRKATREMLLLGQTYEQDGRLNQADAYIRQYSNPRVDFWIRAENAAEDLAAAFEMEREFVASRLKRKNATKLHYIKDLSFWFTAPELADLYAANPLWADVERRVYGSLLSD